MNIKSKISKLVSGLLCFSMMFSNVLPAYAMDAVITENTLGGEDLSVNERNPEDITAIYKQASSFFVTIPKTNVLDGWKQPTYAVKDSGVIGSEQCVYVAPVDGIAGIANIDFYMKDQAFENAKHDVVANVTHNKLHWNSAEVAEGHKQDDNMVSASDLTTGAGIDISQMEINLENQVTHKHNYVETITKEPTCIEVGVKTYTCDCGDSYTEEIPAKGHHFEEGECTDCGEKDSDYHKHSYTETITKEPTCTEVGEKTYTCGCEDSYTEEIAAKGHHYGYDDKCTDCGELNPDHKHNYTETITKEATCTEVGEKTYTCGCGDSYTEEISATGHHYVDGECERCHEKDSCSESHTDENEDGICDICGHEHQWVENEDVLEWVRYNPYNRGGWTKNGNTYEASFSADKTDATKSASIDFDIEVPNDVECTYSFTCPYLYKTDFMYYDNAWAFLYDLDDSGNTINTTSNPRTTIFDVNGPGSGNSSGKISLSKGKHRLSVLYHKGNKSSAISGTVRITLSSMTAQNHVCTECGAKEAHKYVETVTKEATCVESGERKYTCETCGYSYTEEIEATGEHNFVNGICTICGHLNTGVEQIFNASATTTKQSVTSATNPDAHYEVTTLADTYSDNIEILENMLDGEYLGVNYYVYFPTLGTKSYYGESDNINGLWQVQKYNEGINTWEIVYQKNINFDNIKEVEETDDRFNLITPHGRCFFKKFNLEKGTYRVHCNFYAKSGICDRYNHPHYDCNVIASICQINKK